MASYRVTLFFNIRRSDVKFSYIRFQYFHNEEEYLEQMCILLEDILGKCEISWRIFWANVHSLDGYLGQMCILLVDILDKCAFSWWISCANVHAEERSCSKVS